MEKYLLKDLTKLNGHAVKVRFHLKKNYLNIIMGPIKKENLAVEKKKY